MNLQSVRNGAAEHGYRLVKITAPVFKRSDALVRVDEIIAGVCGSHGVRRSSILSDNRSRVVAYARHEIMWLIREHTALSLPQIGELLGRDHTTVLSGIRAHAKRMGQG